MKFKAFRLLLVGSALTLSACSFTDDSLWPSLTGEDPASATTQTADAQTARAAQQTVQQPAATPTNNAQPPLGTGNFEPSGVTAGSATGTFVGKKVVELREELGRLQGNIMTQNSELQKLFSTQNGLF